MSPKVSILVPVFNRVSLISETLAAACAQTEADLEVIVCDNCSTDGTWEVLKDVAAADSRVRIHRHDANIGPVRNWRSCIDMARGRYGKILWSDDLIAPDFLAATLPWLDDPSVGFAYTAATIFARQSDEPGTTTVFDSLPAGVHDSLTFIEGSLLAGDFPLSPGCALFRLDDLKRNLWLDIPNRLGIDFSQVAIGNDLLIFLLTAAQYSRFAFIPRAISSFRAHPESISTSSARGRLPLHYDIAKAAFVESANLPSSLVERFDAKLWLDRQRFGGRSYQIECVADFYPSKAPRPSALAIAGMVAHQLNRKVQGLARRHAGLGVN